MVQPKLVINGVDVLRRAQPATGGRQLSPTGAAFHDSFLTRLVRTAASYTSLPVLLVSSDSYYADKVHEDMGSLHAFLPHEVFGWTPAEAAAHLVPRVFSKLQWQIVAGVVGSNPRHLAELHSLWIQSSPAVQRRDGRESVESVEDCLDHYLALLQVTSVDPALEVAIERVAEYAGRPDSAAAAADPYIMGGTAWRRPPRTGGAHKRRRWAKLQMMDFIEALATAQFGMNYWGVAGGELLEDPVAQALVEVGLLYQQRSPTYIRPTTVAFQRCLARWLVKEKLEWSTADSWRFRWLRLVKEKLEWSTADSWRFRWLRFTRGRSYRHLLKET
eukprot:jgi/Mesen1/7285/ME000373S06353